MQREGFFEVALDGVAGGEAEEGGVVLAGAEEVLGDLGVVVLAGEAPRVVRCAGGVGY